MSRQGHLHILFLDEITMGRVLVSGEEQEAKYFYARGGILGLEAPAVEAMGKR